MGNAGLREETYQDATEHGADSHGRGRRQEVDTRLLCRDSLDGLEPDGNVIGNHEQGARRAEHVHHAGGHRPLPDDAKRQSAAVTLDVLYKEPHQDQDAKEDEAENDAPVAPSVGQTAPLQGQQEADDAGHENGGAFEVELLEYIAGGSFPVLGR